MKTMMTDTQMRSLWIGFINSIFGLLGLFLNGLFILGFFQSINGRYPSFHLSEAFRHILPESIHGRAVQ